MIENEMASIKEKLGNYLRYVIIVLAVIAAMSLVVMLYFNGDAFLRAYHLEEIATASYVETVSVVLKNLYLYHNFGITKGNGTELELAEALAYAEQTLPILTNLLRATTILLMVFGLVAIGGAVVLAVAFKKESLKLVRIAKYIIIGGLSASAITLIVLVSVLFGTQSILRGADLSYFAGGISCGIAMIIILLANFLKMNVKSRKRLYVVAKAAAIVIFAYVIEGFLIEFNFKRGITKEVMTSIDMITIIALFCFAFAVFSYSTVASSLVMLEENKDSDELYANLKEMAKANIKTKEERSRRKSLRFNR